MQDVTIGGHRVKGTWDLSVLFFATSCDCIITSNKKLKREEEEEKIGKVEEEEKEGFGMWSDEK